MYTSEWQELKDLLSRNLRISVPTILYHEQNPGFVEAARSWAWGLPIKVFLAFIQKDVRGKPTEYERACPLCLTSGHWGPQSHASTCSDVGHGQISGFNAHIQRCHGPSRGSWNGTSPAQYHKMFTDSANDHKVSYLLPRKKIARRCSLK